MRKAAAAVRLGLLVVVLGGALLAARHFGFLGEGGVARAVTTVRHLRDIPGIAPLFVLAFGALTAVGVPSTLVTLVGGALFGFWPGILFNWLGAMLGAMLGYSIARLLGRESLGVLLGRRAEGLERIAGTDGFLPLLRLRLIPVVPFSILNVGAGLVPVRLRVYLAATAIGVLPADAVYTYFADSVLTGVADARRSALVGAAAAAALLVLLSFLPTLAQKRPERG